MFCNNTSSTSSANAIRVKGVQVYYIYMDTLINQYINKIVNNCKVFTAYIKKQLSIYTPNIMVDSIKLQAIGFSIFRASTPVHPLLPATEQPN